MDLSPALLYKLQRLADYNTMRAARLNIPGGLRLERLTQTWVNQAGCCCWCQVPMTKDTVSLEHVTALCEGGFNDKHNVALACTPCNLSRHTGENHPGPEHRLRRLPGTYTLQQAHRQLWQLKDCQTRKFPPAVTKFLAQLIKFAQARISRLKKARACRQRTEAAPAPETV